MLSNTTTTPYKKENRVIIAALLSMTTDSRAQSFDKCFQQLEFTQLVNK